MNQYLSTMVQDSDSQRITDPNIVSTNCTGVRLSENLTVIDLQFSISPECRNNFDEINPVQLGAVKVDRIITAAAARGSFWNFFILSQTIFDLELFIEASRSTLVHSVNRPPLTL